MKKWNNDNTDQLLNAVMTLKNKSEAMKFFRDLLTPAEIIEFGKRWQTAKMLNDKVLYVDIEKKTGLSSATIARVSQWLNQGMGGYRLMINRIALHHTNPSGK